MRLEYCEIIWWLDKDHNVPIDIIRLILSEWISYPAIENNDQFRECLRLWFEQDKSQQEERNNMIKKYGHISDWNTKNVTDMSKAFYYQPLFCEDVSQWNVSHVTDMNSMFYCCYKFHCDLSQWDVSNVTNMNRMFFHCHLFHSEISLWNVSNVTNMAYMFAYCHQFSSELSQWNVQQVIDFESMFTNCNMFQSNLEHWSIGSNTRNMIAMFEKCYTFQSNLSDWNMNPQIKIKYMFSDCYKLNCDLSNWNVCCSKKDIISIFLSCHALQDKEKIMKSWFMKACEEDNALIEE